MLIFFISETIDFLAQISRQNSTTMAQQLLSNLISVVNMNNNGAMLFDTQDYDTAMERLTQALRCSKTMIQSLPDQQSSQPLSSQLRIDDWMRDDPSCNVKSTMYSGHFVYNHAIIIPQNECLMHAQEVQHEKNESQLVEVVGDWLNLSCAAIIFNLSLVYQAIAVQTSKRKVAIKALKLFEHAVGLQSTTQESASSGSAMFVLAALNNVGFLHRVLGNTEESKAFSHRILSILMYMVVVGGDTSQYKDFFKNLTPLIHATCAECAGAAWKPSIIVLLLFQQRIYPYATEYILSLSRSKETLENIGEKLLDTNYY